MAIGMQLWVFGQGAISVISDRLQDVHFNALGERGELGRGRTHAAIVPDTRNVMAAFLLNSVLI